MSDVDKLLGKFEEKVLNFKLFEFINLVVYY